MTEMGQSSAFVDRWRTPSAVSSPEAFRTPASAHLITPVPGRRPKTLNDSGRSPDRRQTAVCDPRRSVA